MASFCVCYQWDCQLARHVLCGDVLQLHSGKTAYILLPQIIYIHYIFSFICIYLGLVLLIQHNLFLCVPTQDGLGQFCFLIFVVYSIFSAAFMIYFVPETKGKTMMEIMEDFNKLNYKNRAADIEKTDITLATKL